MTLLHGISSVSHLLDENCLRPVTTVSNQRQRSSLDTMEVRAICTLCAIWFFLMPIETKEASSKLLSQAASTSSPPAHEGAARAFWRVLTRFDSSKLTPYHGFPHPIRLLLPPPPPSPLHIPL